MTLTLEEAWHDNGVQVTATEQPGQARVGHTGTRQHDALQPTNDIIQLLTINKITRKILVLSF